MMLLVVDIGLSYLASVKRAFEIVGGVVVISAASGVISNADAIVLPGVGAFADGMSCLLYTSPSPRDGLLSRMPSSA